MKKFYFYRQIMLVADMIIQKNDSENKSKDKNSNSIAT